MAWSGFSERQRLHARNHADGGDVTRNVLIQKVEILPKTVLVFAPNPADCFTISRTPTMDWCRKDHLGYLKQTQTSVLQP
jgi:hypothetical protein